MNETFEHPAETIIPLRRKLLKHSLLGGALATPSVKLMAKPLATGTNIVIVGAAGTAMANRLRQQLSGIKTTSLLSCFVTIEAKIIAAKIIEAGLIDIGNVAKQHRLPSSRN